MTDRELLERAAKAAGYDFDGNLKHDRYSSNIWDPLHDDGDAFRLMVALGLPVNPEFGKGGLSVSCGLSHVIYLEGWHHDAAAVRRAIVRAAAEMAD